MTSLDAKFYLLAMPGVRLVRVRRLVLHELLDSRRCPEVDGLAGPRGRS
jgi:hypothetical protein